MLCCSFKVQISHYFYIFTEGKLRLTLLISSDDVYLGASGCAHSPLRTKYLDIGWSRCCEIGDRFFCPPQEESESPLSDFLDHISIRTLLPCEKNALKTSHQPQLSHAFNSKYLDNILYTWTSFFVLFWGGGSWRGFNFPWVISSTHTHTHLSEIQIFSLQSCMYGFLTGQLNALSISNFFPPLQTFQLPSQPKQSFKSKAFFF